MVDGFTGSLSLDAIQVALEIEEVPRQYWAHISKRLLRLHHLTSKALRAQKKHDG